MRPLRFVKALSGGIAHFTHKMMWNMALVFNILFDGRSKLRFWFFPETKRRGGNCLNNTGNC